MSEAPDTSVHSGQWEHVTDEHLSGSFQTERLQVPGGWLYRSSGVYGTANSAIALCFIPRLSGENS